MQFKQLDRIISDMEESWVIVVDIFKIALWYSALHTKQHLPNNTIHFSICEKITKHPLQPV
jgi:hypothetical protein